MAFTTVNKSTDYFSANLYTGTGSEPRSLTGFGHQPDWIWVKRRDNTGHHTVIDAVRGGDKIIYPNLTQGEDTATAAITFGTDGMTWNGGNYDINDNGETMVLWSWKAGGGAGSANNDGSINTTSTSVNTAAGISISKFTATGSAATIGHGLGVAPKCIFVKRTDGAAAWQVYHAGIGATKYLELNESQAENAASNRWNDTAPTSTVFSIGSEWGSSQTLVAYAFAEKPGFSKFAYWKGNNNANGTFIYTGFKPAFFISKGANVGQNWFMYDNKRSPINTVNKYVYADGNNAETTGSNVDFLSNGIKIRTTSAGLNGNNTYCGIIFAEAPLVGSNNVPVTAR